MANQLIRQNNSPSTRQISITYFILLFCVICWGSNFIFGKVLVEAFHPLAIAFLRIIFINIFLLLIGWKYFKKYQISWKLHVLLAVAGFIGVTLNQWSFYASLQYADPVNAAIILALAPIVTSLLTFIFLKEKRKLIFWFGLAIGFLGVWLVITNGTGIDLQFGRGEMLISMTMLTFSIFLIMVQLLSKRIAPIMITLYSNIYGLLLFLPFVRIDVIKTSFQVSLQYWLLLIITAIVMHGICTMLWNNSLQVVGAAKASVLMNLEPFIVMIVGYLVLKSTVDIVQIFGALLIITGVVLGSRGRAEMPVGSVGIRIYEKGEGK